MKGKRIIAIIYYWTGTREVNGPILYFRTGERIWNKAREMADRRGLEHFKIYRSTAEIKADILAAKGSEVQEHINVYRALSSFMKFIKKIQPDF